MVKTRSVGEGAAVAVGAAVVVDGDDGDGAVVGATVGRGVGASATPAFWAAAPHAAEAKAIATTDMMTIRKVRSVCISKNLQVNWVEGQPEAGIGCVDKGVARGADRGRQLERVPLGGEPLQIAARAHPVERVDLDRR
jgi:hypothetical protein